MTDMLITFGLSVTEVPVPSPPETLKVTALLQIPLCWILTIPLAAPDATPATTCASVQLITVAGIFPIQITPLPCEAPKPFPVIVTWVPVVPELGLMLAICGKFIVKATELLHTPFCRICADPDAAPVATVARTCPSLQLVTEPGVFPSQTTPLPCTAPKPEPMIVTCVPGTPFVGVTLEIVAAFIVKRTAFEETPLC